MATNRNVAYWTKRTEARENEVARSASNIIDYELREYERLRRDIQKDIENVIKNFKDSNNVVDRDIAIQILNGAEKREAVNKLYKIAEQMAPSKMRDQLMARVNALAYKARVTKLEAMQEEIAAKIKLFADVQDSQLTNEYAKVIYDTYNKTAYDIAKGANIALNFKAINTRAVSSMLTHKWLKGNYSTRIWGNAEKTIKDIQEVLSDGIKRGKSIERMTADLRGRIEVAKSNAVRLIRTEANYFFNNAKIESLKELGFKKYRFVATLDLRTSDICQSLDGKVFDIDDVVVGENCPAMHAYCRSIVIQGDVEPQGQRIARGAVDGENYYIDGKQTYSEWIKEQEAKYGAETLKAIKSKIRNQAVDKEQFARYAAVLGNKAPKSIDEFVNIKYNADKSEWEKLKKLVDGNSRLQQRVQYSGGFIPKSAKFTTIPKTIAGTNHKTPIRDIDSLIKEYGGTKDDWTKKAVKINSNHKSFDVHYYEYNGLQYKVKVKNWKEVNKGET